MDKLIARSGRWMLHIVLFACAAVGAMMAFGVAHLYISFIGWLFLPSGLIYGALFFVALLLCSAIYLLGRRKRWGWLKALALGGASVPALLLVLLLLGPFVLPEPDPALSQKPNQREPSTSPSGAHVLTVPIERSETDKGSFGYGFPYWRVTISDPNGNLLYRDAEDKFAGIRRIYWVWDANDIVWLFDSDDSGVYFYRRTEGQWSRDRWGSGKTGRVELGIAPPVSLYPDYVSDGPGQ